MNDGTKTIALLVGVFLVLTLVSAVVSVLRKRRDIGIDAAVLDTFRSRIHAWWLLFGMLALAFVLGNIMTVLLFGMISFWALREYITLTPTRRADNSTLFWVFFLCTPLQFLLVVINPAWFERVFVVSPYQIFSIFIPAYTFLIIPAAIAVSGDAKHFLERIAKIQVGLLICVYSFSFAPALLTMHFPTPEMTREVAGVMPSGLVDNAVDLAVKEVAGTMSGNAIAPEQGTDNPVAHQKGRELRLLFFFVLIVQSGDVFQYLWSHIPRRHVVAPSINSTRTWEGVLGGAATNAIFATSLWAVTPFPEWWQAAMGGFLVSIMGFAGNLTMSAIKRDRGVDDFGKLIEGHNGVLDRIDSLCFAAPVFYHFVWLCVHVA
jgi:phosphatidate cytidylyltransferase